MRRRQFITLLAGAGLLAVAPRAFATEYPTRPVRWIIGFPPGGGADQVARLIAPSLSERLGQQVVIENRPGAGTFLSVQAVLNSAPDGYTLLHYGGSTLMNAKISANPPPLEEGIAPVAGLVAYPMILVAHPLFPAKTVPELIDYAKSNPGKVTMASFGIGTASHLAGELLKQMAGINMVHVPYRGGGPAVADLLGGQVLVYFGTFESAIENVRAGKLRALAVTLPARVAVLPNVPAMAEFLAGYEASIYVGIAAPRGVDVDIVEQLNKTINLALADANMTRRIAELGDTPLPLSTSEFANLVVFEIEKWRKVIAAANIKAE